VNVPGGHGYIGVPGYLGKGEGIRAECNVGEGSVAQDVRGERGDIGFD